MKFVPVVCRTGKTLMPCHPARARELVRKDRAVRRFNRGVFYVQLLDREGGETQEVVVGVDPGSRKEAYTVKSEAHTYLNIQADTPRWVKRHVEQRRVMRRGKEAEEDPLPSKQEEPLQRGHSPIHEGTVGMEASHSLMALEALSHKPCHRGGYQGQDPKGKGRPSLEYRHIPYAGG